MSTTLLPESISTEKIISAPTNDATVVIAVRSVDKTFVLHPQGGVRLEVLAGADFDVRTGEGVALTGPSGAGKSTLLRCLYANYRPTGGHVWIRHRGDWVDLTSALPTEVIDIRRHTVGWVSQFLRVIPRVPTLDIVAEPLLAQGHDRSEAYDRATSLLRRFNIPERLWSLAPATFSGGEQQRVNVARGLVGGHPILLVDEPTASLDPANRDVVIEQLNVARANGTALVGIFHDPDVRQQVAPRSVDVARLLPAGHTSTSTEAHPSPEEHDSWHE